MRNTKIVTIDEGRDKGKAFLITEPDAFTGEALFVSLVSLCGNRLTIDEIMSKVATERGAKIWASLLDHVKIIPTPSSPDILREIESDDIQEFNTLIKLRSEALGLILGFSKQSESNNTESNSQA